MGRFLMWFFILLIISECTCYEEKKCVDTSKISVIMNLNTKSCDEKSWNSFQELGSVDYFTKQYSYSFNGFKMEIAFFDTCGRDTGTLAAVFKTLVWTNTNCLHPPYFLGFIGPDSDKNLKIAQHISSVSNIPHFVNIPSTSINTYHILSTADYFLLKAIFKLIDVLGWKSFILNRNIQSDVLENIRKGFAAEATARNLCLLSTNETSQYVIYIGQPDRIFLNTLQNSFIIIISDEDFEKETRILNSNNSFLFLNYESIENENYDSNGEEVNLLNSNAVTLFNNKQNLQFVQDSMDIYTKALDVLCKNKNCRDVNNYDELNRLIKRILLTSHNQQNELTKKTITLKMKKRNEKFNSMGEISDYNNEISMYWKNELLEPNEKDKHIDLKYFMFNETNVKCNKKNSIFNIFTPNKELTEKDKLNKAMISEYTELEWWTMIGTVAAVGILMFGVGFFAVYMVYTNVRDPRVKNNDASQDSGRNFSLRRVGSERTTVPTISRNGLQRRDSRNSMRSNFSDKSV